MPRSGYEDDRIDYLFKLVIIGDSGVGKTSLLLRYVDDVFTETFISTIGVDFKIRSLEIDGKKVKLQIWDTAGQDRFRNIVSTFYRAAHAVIIVYDITDMTSLNNIMQWRKEVDRYAGTKTKQVLVGNKCDLESQREVSEQDARATAERCDMTHLETSAKTSHNLTALFTDLTRALMESVEPVNYDRPTPKPPKLPDSHKVGTGGICNC